jgi:phage host-nuclease inhibitor protein Gam
MTYGELIQAGLITALAVIGYFLRMVHTDVRKAVEDMGKLKGKVELVEQEARLKYQAIQEQTQLEIKMLAKNVSDLSNAVKELMIKLHN